MESRLEQITLHMQVMLEEQRLLQAQVGDIQKQLWENSKQHGHALGFIQTELQTLTTALGNDHVMEEPYTHDLVQIQLQDIQSEPSSSEDERFKATDLKRKQLSRAIKNHMVDIVACLPFLESDIPDLIIPECISENECEPIRKLKNRKDQVRTLIRIVTKRDFQSMKKLLEVIEDNNNVLGQAITDTFQRLGQERTDMGSPCTVCAMRGRVNIKDVCDFYFSKELMMDKLHRDITETLSKEGEQDDLWKRMLGEISVLRPELGMTIMIEALKAKGSVFSDIVQMLQRDITKHRSFECRCQVNLRSQVVPNLRESTASLCSTSTSVIARSTSSESLASMLSTSDVGFQNVTREEPSRKVMDENFPPLNTDFKIDRKRKGNNAGRITNVPKRRGGNKPKHQIYRHWGEDNEFYTKCKIVSSLEQRREKDAKRPKLRKGLTLAERFESKQNEQIHMQSPATLVPAMAEDTNNQKTTEQASHWIEDIRQKPGVDSSNTMRTYASLLQGESEQKQDVTNRDSRNQRTAKYTRSTSEPFRSGQQEPIALSKSMYCENKEEVYEPQDRISKPQTTTAGRHPPVTMEQGGTHKKMNAMKESRKKFLRTMKETKNRRNPD